MYKVSKTQDKMPASKGYVEALEKQIAVLEIFIAKLAAADSRKRDEMLNNFGGVSSSGRLKDQPTKEAGQSSEDGHTNEKADLANLSNPFPRRGHLLKVPKNKSAKFYGATSFFQVIPSTEQELPSVAAIAESNATRAISPTVGGADSNNHIVFGPQSDLCRHLLSTFFQHLYPYHMYFYREYFLRSYNAGGGPYYSDLLLYSICAFSALIEDSTIRDFSDMFAARAEGLLFGSALESPGLTTLQSLLLLGQREIGIGKSSKGWLFTGIIPNNMKAQAIGMAFRLTYEMGLYIDPNNWTSSSSFDLDREIQRRVYWAAFIADKQLSLYFGRPPALGSRESDVRNTIRIPYPPDWDGLLDAYIKKNISKSEFEDGPALVGAFIYQAELCKIVHRMITEIFENRSAKTDESILNASVNELHVLLTKWLTDLPTKLHWNEWMAGQVAPYVIHLHMLYQSVVIILHRPRLHLFPGNISTADDTEMCYTSLNLIIKLLRLYSRYYDYRHLPITFVHIAATAASIILQKRLAEPGGDENETDRQLKQILDAIDGVSESWPCAKTIKEVIMAAATKKMESPLQIPSPGDSAESNFDPLTEMMDPDLMFPSIDFSWADFDSETFIST
ncbi:MAG: hypothetical protein M1834_006890 [Cirrosporium novae-zelandiae]|nr:MAG: hypothetical protein M1834_006890 [Cirrosporium novae-zelandiae]